MKEKSSLRTKSHKGQLYTNPFIQLVYVSIATSMFFFGNIFDSFTTPKLLAMSLGCLCIAVSIFRLKDKIRFSAPTKFLVYLIVANLLVTTLASLNSSMPLTRQLFGQFGRGNGLLYYFFAYLILLFTLMTFDLYDAKAFTKTISLFTWILSAYALLQEIGLDVGERTSAGLSPVTLGLGNSNFAGGLLAVLFTFHVVSASTKKTISKIDLCMLVALTTAIFLTGAVQSYIVVILSILFALSTFVNLKLKNRTLRWLTLMSWILVTIFVSLGIFGKFIFSGIFQRGSFQDRIEYWKIAIEIIKENLLFGVGPDGVFDVSSMYLTPEKLEQITVTRMDNVHNWFLNYAANFGLIAGFLHILIVIYILLISLRLLTKDKSKNLVLLPFFSTYVAICILGMVSIEQPGFGVWLYLFGGIVVSFCLQQNIGSQSSDTPRKGVKKYTYRSGLGMLSLIAILIFTSSIISLRISEDQRLRSSIQDGMLGNLTSDTVKEITKNALQLTAEPEYAYQSIKWLSTLGDLKSIQQISSAYYNHNPNSIQAIMIQVEVLSANGVNSAICPLVSRLIQVNPFEKGTALKYFYCLEIGFGDEKQRANVKKIQNFLPPPNSHSFNGKNQDIESLNESLLYLALISSSEKALGREIESNRYRFEAIKILDYLNQQEVGNGVRIPNARDRIYIRRLLGR
jgi:O-antigen ligase